MSSNIDLAKAVGFQADDQPVSWNQRDLILYALGIGAKKEDFHYVYELDKNWAPFPTYPTVLALKGADTDLNLFKDRVKGGRAVPGLPAFDPNRGVHGSQSIEILRPIPAVSGPGWKLSNRVTSVVENKSGIIVERESLLLDPQGTPYAKLFGASFNIGAHATGEKFAKSIAGPPQGKPIPKDRKPCSVVRDQTTTEQAAIYRLSGDYNPLHIDPSIGARGGFGGIILHGLSTFGFGARAVLSYFAPDDPNALVYYGVRFTAPVVPGDALETRMWDVGEVKGKSAVREVVFETVNVRTGKVVLGSGVAWVKIGGAKEKSKL